MNRVRQFFNGSGLGSRKSDASKFINLGKYERFGRNASAEVGMQTPIDGVGSFYGKLLSYNRRDKRSEVIGLRTWLTADSAERGFFNDRAEGRVD